MFGQVGVCPSAEGQEEVPGETPDHDGNGDAAFRPAPAGRRRWGDECLADVELVVRRAGGVAAGRDFDSAPNRQGNGLFVFPVHSDVVMGASRPLREKVIAQITAHQRSAWEREGAGRGDSGQAGKLTECRAVVMMNGDANTAAALDLLLDLMYTGRCDVIDAWLTEASGPEGPPAGGGGVGVACRNLEAATAWLAKGLGLGSAAALLKGKLPSLGQGLPLFGPSFQRLLPSRLFLLQADGGQKDRAESSWTVVHYDRRGDLREPTAETGVPAPVAAVKAEPEVVGEGDLSKVRSRSGSGSVSGLPVGLSNDTEGGVDADGGKVESQFGHRHRFLGSHLPLEEHMRTLAAWQLKNDSAMQAAFLPRQLWVGPEEVGAQGLLDAPRSSEGDAEPIVSGCQGSEEPRRCTPPAFDVLLAAPWRTRPGSDPSDPRSDLDPKAIALERWEPSDSELLAVEDFDSVLLIPAHRVVLAHRCDVFRAALLWQQQQQQQHVRLPDPVAAGGPIKDDRPYERDEDERREGRVAASTPASSLGRRRRVPLLSVPEADAEVALLLQVRLQG